MSVYPSSEWLMLHREEQTSVQLSDHLCSLTNHQMVLSVKGKDIY